MVRWVSKPQEETKWHDGEKTFTNARMVGGKVDTSKRAHRKAKSSGATSTEWSMQRSNGCSFRRKQRRASTT